jgi:hypothetical protein
MIGVIPVITGTAPVITGTAPVMTRHDGKACEGRQYSERSHGRVHGRVNAVNIFGMISRILLEFFLKYIHLYSLKDSQLS